jgi:hypothetical protein
LQTPEFLSEKAVSGLAPDIINKFYLSIYAAVWQSYQTRMFYPGMR